MEQEQGTRNYIYEKCNKDQDNSISIKQIKNIHFLKGGEKGHKSEKTKMEKEKKKKTGGEKEK